MARLQRLTSLPNVTLAVPGTAYPLTADPTIFVKSVVLQSPNTNTGTLRIGDSAAQTMQLAIGLSCTIYGDNMDNGTSARLQLSSIFVASTVGGDKVSITALEGL